jgi:NitT/TauT family transport system substrate-binding protein
MNKHKRSVVVMLVVSLVLTACVKATPETLKVATLAGPTGMGLVNIIDDTSGLYETEIYTAPDQIMPKIISGEIDIASVPSNMAALIYAKTEGKIAILSTTVAGVLHIVENGDTIKEIVDLKGKTLYASGQGASPEYILNHILSENGLEPGVDVEIKYVMQHADLANMVAAGDAMIALLPEPFVSIVTAKNTQVLVKVDFNEEWKKLYGDESSLPMGVTIVNKVALEEKSEAVLQFIKKHKASVEFVLNSSEEASVLIAEQGIIPSAGIAQSAIPKSNIHYTEGESMKEILNNFFTILFKSNPQSVGGSVPDEGIYYIP